mgnify:CR=1 FL=1
MVQVEKRWYAVRVRNKTERQVSKYFTTLDVEHYLPIQQRVYKRGTKRIEKEVLPIPRMVFVRIPKRDMVVVRQTPNVYNFICDRINNRPEPIPHYQMVNFKMMVEVSEKDIIMTEERLPKGTPVEVMKGELEGLCGDLIRYDNKYHLVVRVDLLGSALVRMPASWVRRVKEG